VKFTLCRHAQPLIAPGVCYGQLDVPADAEATRICAESLAAQLEPGLQIACSPLQRCEQLRQELIGLQSDLPSKTDPRLAELNFGDWEGQAWADIAPSELKAWTDDFAHYRVGRCGESTAQFIARVASAVDDIPPDTPTLWITHAGVIRAVSLILAGQRHIERADQWPAAAPAFGKWTVFQW
jgi:alpha-ribazole phosphatase